MSELPTPDISGVSHQDTEFRNQNPNHPMGQSSPDQGNISRKLPTPIQPRDASAIPFSNLSRSLSSQPSSSNYKGISASKWKIRFNGSVSGENIKRFLFKVENLADNNNIPSFQMVTDLNYLLQDNAADFYWTFIERNPATTWSQLKTALLKRFQDRRSDDEIRWMLEARKQKPRESFNEFYSDILKIALQCESPLSDNQLINIMQRNMRPGLQDKLVDQQFACIEDLVRRCVAYEDTWVRTGFVPEMLCTNRKYVYAMNHEPYDHANPDNQLQAGFEQELFELQYGQTSVPRATNQTGNPTRYPDQSVKPNISNYNRNSQHRPYCYGCGEPGVLKSNCLRCKNHWGNEWREPRAGNTPPPKITIAARPIQPEIHSVETASNTDPELRRLASAQPK